MLVVDSRTASAAEEFAAIIQDNKAGVIVGAPTLGAGCGYTDGGVKAVLKNSGAIAWLPDCARFRADGSNEVRGVDPDVYTGFRSNEGSKRRAERLMKALPAAVKAADALVKQ
jgi:C-terminal processing protease CtpA/Prc